MLDVCIETTGNHLEPLINPVFFERICSYCRRILVYELIDLEIETNPSIEYKVIIHLDLQLLRSLFTLIEVFAVVKLQLALVWSSYDDTLHKALLPSSFLGFFRAIVRLKL